MTIKNIHEAEKALLPYVPIATRPSGQSTPLAGVESFMRLLGNPQDRLRVIHIAGTSGKTSTAYYAAALLVASGKQVGLAVSPHVDSIAERVQLNGQPLPEAEFCAELGTFLGIVREAAQPPSYFVLLYAFALWVFERRAVDYAVIETGMGGLFDATNVARRPDKVCIITDIGLDHTHLLGNTLAEIATQKIGIVHKGNEVFMYRQADEIMSVFEQWIKQQQASINIINDGLTGQEYSPTMPKYQKRNWHLAYSVFCYVAKRDDLPRLTSQVLLQTQLISVPARMDIRQAASKTVVMDGAHNAQKMAAFIDSFQHLYPGIKPAILLALKEGKEYQQVVNILATVAGSIITTIFNTTQDLPTVSMDPDLLAKACCDAGIVHVQSIRDQKTAIRVLLQSPENTCVITGSFYLLSQIRNNESIL